jgi:hypothetical protein
MSDMAVRVIDPTQPRLLTVEEWVEHPEADQYELIDGVLRARMVNRNRHEYAVARLVRILDEFLDRLYEPFGRAEGVDEFHSQLLPGLSFSVGRLWMRQP